MALPFWTQPIKMYRGMQCSDLYSSQSEWSATGVYIWIYSGARQETSPKKYSSYTKKEGREALGSCICLDVRQCQEGEKSSQLDWSVKSNLNPKLKFKRFKEFQIQKLVHCEWADWLLGKNLPSFNSQSIKCIRTWLNVNNCWWLNPVFSRE